MKMKKQEEDQHQKELFFDIVSVALRITNGILFAPYGGTGYTKHQLGLSSFWRFTPPHFCGY